MVCQPHLNMWHAHEHVYVCSSVHAWVGMCVSACGWVYMCACVFVCAPMCVDSLRERYPRRKFILMKGFICVNVHVCMCVGGFVCAHMCPLRERDPSRKFIQTNPFINWISWLICNLKKNWIFFNRKENQETKCSIIYVWALLW